jgi:hypothetical protein
MQGTESLKKKYSTDFSQDSIFPILWFILLAPKLDHRRTDSHIPSRITWHSKIKEQYFSEMSLADYPMTQSHKTDSSNLTYIKPVIITVRKNKYKGVCVILKYGYDISLQVLFPK